ncbi:MAG: DUF1194 domain-containing protein [Alsobacter sp.]
MPNPAPSPVSVPASRPRPGRRTGRPRAGWVAAAALGLAALAGTLPAHARNGSIEVDVELVLAVDISYSMDPEEQALQRQGYVEALNSPLVLDAIKKGLNGKIAVTYVEWAGTSSQDVVVDWQIIDSAESARAFTDTLQNRAPRRLYRTSISGALDFAVPLFEKNDFRGIKRVIDVSGDGSNNQGRPVTEARDDALAQGITINGLPIMLNRPNMGYPDVEPLDAYYSQCVIGGPAAFVVPVRERGQFIDAVKTKILLEVALTPPPDWPARVIPAQVETPRVSCMFGEKMWQQRWGNGN